MADVGKASASKVYLGILPVTVAAMAMGFVFAAAPPARAQTFTVLHNFTSSNGDGRIPNGGLAMDRRGNLYGATCYGGTTGAGTVFKIDTSGNETVLHSFSEIEGLSPSGVLIMDKAGNLYGTTQLGGASGFGIVFKLAVN